MPSLCALCLCPLFVSLSPFTLIDAMYTVNRYSALNWAPPDCTPSSSYDWYVERIDDAFGAVAAANLDFKLIYSFDMSYTPASCSIPWNTTFMATMIDKYAKHQASYRWNGDILVSTYAGEGYGDSFFAELKKELRGQGISISLAPALTTYADAAHNKTVNPTEIASSMLENYTSIDGYLNCKLPDFYVTQSRD